MLGQESGAFGNMTAYTAGNGPLDPVVADFNGDGVPDIAIENYTDGTESLLLGNGDGTFQTQSTFPTGTNPYAAAVGDFNGDGNPDLAISNFGSNNETILLDQVTSTATAVTRTFAFREQLAIKCSRQLPGDANFTASTSIAIPLIELRAATSGDNPHSDG